MAEWFALAFAAMTDRQDGEYKREARELLEFLPLFKGGNYPVDLIAKWLRQRDQEHARPTCSDCGCVRPFPKCDCECHLDSLARPAVSELLQAAKEIIERGLLKGKNRQGKDAVEESDKDLAAIATFHAVVEKARKVVEE